MSPTPTIRTAKISDAPAIARIHVETWRHAYRDIVPAAHLAGLDIAARTAKWTTSLAETPSNTIVAHVTTGEVHGWASWGKSRDADLAVSGELYAIYVDHRRLSHGIGSHLMRWVCHDLYAHGYPTVALWVLQDNHPGMRFYTRHGFAPTGSRKTVCLGGQELVEVRMVAALPAEPSSGGSYPT